MWLDTVLALSQILVNLEQYQQIRYVFYKLENQVTLSNRWAIISPECGGDEGWRSQGIWSEGVYLYVSTWRDRMIQHMMRNFPLCAMSSKQSLRTQLPKPFTILLTILFLIFILSVRKEHHPPRKLFHTRITDKEASGQMRQGKDKDTHNMW